MSALTLPVRQRTSEWLAARRDGIGSSDAPIVAGESPYRSALDLWAEKSGLLEPAEPDEATARLMRIGLAIEPVLLALYAAETGRRVRREHRLLRHRTLPWMLASLDARVPGERRIVEAKWTHARRWHEAEAVPGDVQVQVQHAMAVSGAEVADVVALVGAELRIVEVPRDERFLGDLIELEADFWRCVTEGRPPSIDGSEATRRTLARLHPQNDGRLLAPDAVSDELARRLEEAKLAEREAVAQTAAVENAFRALIGEADGIAGPGYRVTWRRNADSTRINWPAVAKGYRALLDAAACEHVDAALAAQALDGLDTLVASHSETAPGPRVLRASFKEEGS